MIKYPRVSFGIIVLNGEPFVLYNLRALYPFAHQIIVVEGAAPAATGIATADGHSVDGTLSVLHNFMEHEDVDHKLVLVTAEDEGYPDGFWPGEKHEQSQAYAKRATGEYLWQVDIDEFYRGQDIISILGLLRNDPGITAVSFETLTFWGGFDYITDGFYLRKGAREFHRLFRWGPGYTYVTHRPPTVHDPLGNDLRKKHWIRGKELSRKDIHLFHYSLLFPKQVQEKCTYYDQASWVNRTSYRQWADNNFFGLKNPFRVHNVYDSLSWLERHHGTHPHQIEAMRNDIANGLVEIELRGTSDIEKLLNNRRYAFQSALLKLMSHCCKAFHRYRNSGRLEIQLALRMVRFLRRLVPREI